MGLTRIGLVLGSGRWRTLRVSAATLAVVGVLGAVPPAVASASPQQAPDWAKQAPAGYPLARIETSMAYDAATGTVVLFGGRSAKEGQLGDTWTWDGTTWTRQHPATSPSARYGASMAYDAATGTVVLFGGNKGNGCVFGDTWTWDGTTWTEQAPATRPSARGDGAMAYDAATGTAVLFGGDTITGCNQQTTEYLAQTWTWG